MVPYKIGRSSLDKERAVVHDHQPVAEPGSLVEIMRGEDNGISLRPEKLKAVPDQVSCLRVEADGRLVKDEQVRVVDERPGEDEPAFHAPGELVDGGVALLGERHKCEQVLHPPFCLCRRDIKVPGIGEKVSCTREVRVKVGFLRDDADPLFDPGRVYIRVHVEDTQGSGCAGGDTFYHPHGGGFSCPVRSEEAEDLPFLHGKPDMADCNYLVVGLGQVVGLDDIRHLFSSVSLSSSRIHKMLSLLRKAVTGYAAGAEKYQNAIDGVSSLFTRTIPAIRTASSATVANIWIASVVATL